MSKLNTGLKNSRSVLTNSGNSKITQIPLKKLETKTLAIIDSMSLLSIIKNNDNSSNIELVLSISTPEKTFENEAFLK